MVAANPAPASRVLRPDARLERWRRFHVAAVLLIPGGATAVSLYLAAMGHVAPWQPGLALAFWFSCGIGITVGYHRLFAHRAFETGAAVKFALAALGGMAFQGPIVYWAALHRHHHALSDRDGDPHSPLVYDGKPLGGLSGFLHAHLFWLYRHALPNPLRYAPDLLADPFVARLNRAYLGFALAGLLLPAAIGAAIDRTWNGALAGLLWGGLVRLCVTGHLIWSVNSLAHLTGSQDHRTGDGSRNVAWLAVPTLGEAWHNEHHAFPAAAVFTDRWWRIDVGGLCVRLLERFGLAWKVRSRLDVGDRHG